MKKLFVFILILISTNLFGYVFVNSIPMKAQVYLDGEPIGETPMLIKKDLTGGHTLKFEKNGYFLREEKINIKNDVTNIYVELTPFAFSLYFPGQKVVTVNQKTYDNERIKNIPEGFYHFRPGKSGIDMTRRNPNKKYFWISLGVGLVGTAMGVNGIIFGQERYDSFKRADNYEDAVEALQSTATLDALAIIGMSMAGVGTLGTIYFGIDDVKYQAKAKQIKIDSEEYKSDDIVLYENAMDEYSQDNKAEALASFTKLQTEYPESRFLPVSLLRRSSIYAGDNDFEKAIADLENIKKNYPIYEIYEYTLKLLGDYYIGAKNYNQAIANYKEMQKVKKSYPASRTEYLIIKAMVAHYNATKDSSLLGELKKMIKTYTGNSEYPVEQRNELKNIRLS